MPKKFRGRNNSRRGDGSVEESSRANQQSTYCQENQQVSVPGKRTYNGNKGGRIARNRPRSSLDTPRLQRIIEQDVEMPGSSTQGRQPQQFKTYRSNTSLRRNQEPSKGPRKSSKDSSWRKITIPFGKKYEKGFILKTLLNASKVPFIPIYYHIEGNNAVFFVEEAGAAESLSSLNKQITLHDGFQLAVSVKWSPAPNFPINSDLKEKIKLVMSRRYDPVTKVLNLSQFHLDEELCTDYYAPLNRENVMQTVVQVIGDHIPDVQAIDASNNKIFNVDQMKSLITSTAFLKSLNLANNRLSQIIALDRLQGLPIEDLILNQNSLCDRFDDQASYISAVRKRFPKLVKLDGVDLPPIISFDIGAVTLPKSRGSWFVSEDARQIVLAFLEQYLSVYDSDDRQPLLNAYHDSAVMSLTCSYPPGHIASAGSSRLDPYMKDNRNLKRVDDIQRRFRLLQLGKVDVVSFLSKLPKTLHCPRSLLVDVPVASSHLIVTSVTGIFRERIERHSFTRWFQRVFVIIPSNIGFCIVNEQLHITCATSDQMKSAFKDTSIPVSETGPSASILPSVSVPEVRNPEPSTIDPLVKKQMAISFAEQSGMNAEWSLKCLEENSWNFDLAAYVFSELKNSNQIPAEAFLK